jgi:hypothetical protein
MSTALERVMRERGDCRCFHEPFMYHYYVDRGVRDMPHFDVDREHPVRFDDIVQRLLSAAETAPVFVKDMSYYVVPTIFDHPDLAGRFTHAFLIRDPRRAIVSYHKLDPEVTLAEIGFESQWRQFEWLRAVTGWPPIVLEAEAVQRDPRAVVSDFWRRIGLPIRDGAFAWSEAAAPRDWARVSAWHGTVSTSEGIEARDLVDDDVIQARFDAAAARAPRLLTYLKHHQAFYERLRAHRSDLPRRAPLDDRPP